MLVLSRKKNESIVIGDDVFIVVVEIRGDKVRLGIDAPKSVTVHRREIYDRIKCSEGLEKTPQDDSTSGNQMGCPSERFLGKPGPLRDQ